MNLNVIHKFINTNPFVYKLSAAQDRPEGYNIVGTSHRLAPEGEKEKKKNKSAKGGILAAGGVCLFLIGIVVGAAF